jgi:hypothetical protein
MTGARVGPRTSPVRYDGTSVVSGPRYSGRSGPYLDDGARAGQRREAGAESDVDRNQRLQSKQGG